LKGPWNSLLVFFADGRDPEGLAMNGSEWKEPGESGRAERPTNLHEEDAENKKAGSQPVFQNPVLLT